MNLLYFYRYSILKFDVLRYRHKFVILIGHFWRLGRYTLHVRSMDREGSEALGLEWLNKSVQGYIYTYIYI